MTFGDETSFIDFMGGNAIMHSIFATAIRRLGGAPYATLPLGMTARSTWLLGEPEEPDQYPYLPDDDWMAVHQLVHDGEAASLLIASPPDLRSYDLRDRDEFATWCFLHSQEMVRIRQAIGI